MGEKEKKKKGTRTASTATIKEQKQGFSLADVPLFSYSLVLFVLTVILQALFFLLLLFSSFFGVFWLRYVRFDRPRRVGFALWKITWDHEEMARFCQNVMDET